MDKREKLMYEKIRKERHPQAYLAMETIRYLKEICSEHKFCDKCKFSKENKCIFTCKKRFEEIDEIEIVERIYK